MASFGGADVSEALGHGGDAVAQHVRVLLSQLGEHLRLMVLIGLTPCGYWSAVGRNSLHNDIESVTEFDPGY